MDSESHKDDDMTKNQKTNVEAEEQKRAHTEQE